MDRVARSACHQLPLHPDVSAASLHQHHPDLLQLLPQPHLPAGLNVPAAVFIGTAGWDEELIGLELRVGCISRSERLCFVRSAREIDKLEGAGIVIQGKMSNVSRRLVAFPSAGCKCPLLYTIPRFFFASLHVQ